jgi:hypothetical protein
MSPCAAPWGKDTVLAYTRAAARLSVAPRHAKESMRYLIGCLTLVASASCGYFFAQKEDNPNLLLADFEGDTYGDWVTTGDAFGKGPAHGPVARVVRCPKCDKIFTPPPDAERESEESERNGASDEHDGETR